jgi:hypothetical protein
MVLFACDWCKTIKQDGDVWILGLAAESIGVTAALREIDILSAWDDAHTCDRLAVHFCSIEHKDKYMAALFQTEEPVAETVIEAKATVGSGRTTERKYMRSAGSSATTSTTKKRAVKKRRRAA